jgi:hypothetical protein
MNAAPPPPRGFFLPAFGLVVLFALLGPAVGGAVFIPVALMGEAGADSAPHIGWIAGLIGHAFALIPAYLVGFWPAAFTGLVYALYDAWAPAFAPRALGAALIGALVAHGLYLALMSLGGTMQVWVEGDFGTAIGDMVQDWTAGEFDVSLYRALVVSGAAAGLVCAMIAGLLGLSVRRT